MFEKIFEWGAAKKNPRFQVFVQAKATYESYLQDLRMRFDEMSLEHYDQAQRDPRVRSAEHGFEAAIAMCGADHALADAAVAKFQLGMIYHAQGKLDASATLMHSALEVFNSLPHRNRGADMSGCYYHLGIIAMKQQRFAEAIRDLSRSRQMDEANGDFSGVQACDLALANCPKPETKSESSNPVPTDEMSDWDVPENSSAFISQEDSQPYISRETEYASYDVRQLIWVGSYTVEANDTLMTHLESLGNEFGRPVTIARAAFGAQDPKKRSFEPPDADQHLCAAILILEKTGLTDKAFRDLAAWSIRWVVTTADFRLLVYLHDLTVEQLREMADYDPLVAALFDTTQIADTPSLEQLRRSLVPFIHTVEGLRAKAVWREYRLRCTRICGGLSTLILLLAAGMGLLGFPAWLLKSQLPSLGPHGPEIASFVFGTLAFPLQSPLMFMLLRGMRTTVLAPRDNVYFMRWVFVGFTISMGAAHFRQSMQGPLSYLLLGLAFGVLLDVIRRAGRRAWRQSINVEALMTGATDGAWSDPKMTVMGGDSLKPFSCPLLPSLTPRVFISYTRSSTRASRFATALYCGLKEARAIPYLDRASNPTGASWRRSLNEQLGECDAFVCILDEKSIQRPWVAAEMLTAIKSNRAIGTPDIIILIDPAIRRSPTRCLPIFQGIIASADEPPVVGRPQILMLNGQTQSSLVWALAPGRFMPLSVFPRSVALPIMSILIIIGALGTLGLVAGWILGFLAVLQQMAKFPFVAQVESHGWTSYLVVLTAFWLGFTARATIAWGYEREQRSSVGGAMPTIASCGLAFTLCCFYGKVPILVVGWSVVLAVFGWVIVASAMRSGGRTEEKGA